MAEKRTVPPDWHLIRVNDLAFWREDIREKCDAIWTVYAFDRASHTHCCELTPSYCLWWVGCEPELKETVEGDDERDAVYETVWSADPGETVEYMHVSTVERMAEAHPDRLSRVDLTPELEDRIVADRIRGAYQEGRIT